MGKRPGEQYVISTRLRFPHWIPVVRKAKGEGKKRNTRQRMRYRKKGGGAAARENPADPSTRHYAGRSHAEEDEKGNVYSVVGDVLAPANRDRLFPDGDGARASFDVRHGPSVRDQGKVARGLQGALAT